MSTTESDTEKLLQIFNRLFMQTENTLLKMGANEPFYRAAKDGQKAIVFAREDFFSSALHEIAHWTIAGKERREIDDFGYWYEPEGRSDEQQKKFEQAEIKPQAVEWLLSLACNHPFHFSADNLSQAIDASDNFKRQVRSQAKDYLASSMPKRALLFFEQLKQYYRNGQEVVLPSV